ncbi:MAG TPA: SDR family oxidoreductase [Pseudomonadales bacterium]|nr:SDR family oxidoreductase [Pseudomonadales bacterium]
MKRTAIITGGTKGLGREIALAFGRAGYTVLALYSSDAQAAAELDAALAEIKASGGAVRHDVCSDEPAVWNRPEIQEAESLTLVHNACAAFSPLAMHQLGWADFEKNISVAVKGAWSCSQRLIPLMVKRKSGAIVTILTNAIEALPPKGFAAYATAKHALHGFTLALATEYSSRGIKAFSVSPGYMDTPLSQQWDARLRELIRANSERITIPATAAVRIVELVGDGNTPGKGEIYPV